MIRKIDANEYGVVKYAITSVDELNRLPKKIAPSSQAILIENGLRVFVYGDGQWVEEVVDGDLSENMRSIVADYERSKIGYDGVKRGSLEERLKDDFQGIYDILNARDYCEYSGKELKVDNTWMGNQIDTRIEGRTLQNLTEIILPDTEYVVDGKIKVQGEGKSASFIMGTTPLIKSNTTYTLLINVSKAENLLETNFFQLTIGERVLEVYFKAGLKKIKFTTGNLGSKNLVFYFWTDYRTENGYLEVDPKQILILEGDHTQTPLSELPYFEGIKSVGDKSKNLFDINLCNTPPSVGLTFNRNNGDLFVSGTSTGIYDIYLHLSGTTGNSLKLSQYINSLPVGTTLKLSNNLGLKGYFSYQDESGSISYTGDSYTIKANQQVNACFVRIETGQSLNNTQIKIQLEESATATAYEPYYDDYRISGKSHGKNLINPKKVKGKSTTSINVIDSNTFEVSTNGSWQGILFDDIELKEGKKYTFTYDCEDDLVIPYMTRKENGAYGTITHYGGKNPMVVTPTNDITVRVSITSKQVMDGVIIKNIILTESDDISYEPYQESTYSIHSPIPLRSLPNGVCDVYDFESGAVIQKVGKVVLDGSEDWRLWYENTTVVSFYVTIKDKISHHNILCDKFGLGKSYVDDIEGITVSGSPSTFGVAINKSKLPSVDIQGLKDWLRVNPTTVYYELEEPIIHYLTPSQLKSFEGTTHVTSENTLIPTTTTKILTSTYANVSNVNSTAYSLRRGVNDVAETSDIINEIDVEQDDVLDITMCAIDELYSMLEPNLE